MDKEKYNLLIVSTEEFKLYLVYIKCTTVHEFTKENSLSRVLTRTHVIRPLIHILVRISNKKN